MNIIGQHKLLSKIETYYNMNNLPKTQMLIGPSGCGKHTFAKYVADKFSFDYVEINENISNEVLLDYLHSTISTLYVIDLSQFTEKEQNTFLKALEEPSKSAYFVLLANSEAGVLNTILNRCVKHTFESYTKEELEQITMLSVDGLAFKIFKTPGKIIKLSHMGLQNLLNAAGNLVCNIDKLMYGNALVVSTKINYKDLYDKLDFDLFLDTVEYLALENYKNTANEKSFTIFKITNQFKQCATQSRLIRETLMLNYLTNLWEAVQ